LGDSGNDVRELQHTLQLLATAGDPPLVETGVFDEATRLAVLSFQRRRHLRRADGVVGPETQAALYLVQRVRLRISGPATAAGHTSTAPALPNRVDHVVPVGGEAPPGAYQIQIQSGGGISLDGNLSGQLALTFVVRTPRWRGSSPLSDDPHTEHSWTTALIGSGTGSGVQIAYQVALADLVAFGRAHLLTLFYSPYVSIPFTPSPTNGVQIGLQGGVQMGIDLVPNRLQIGLQGSLAAFYDFGTRSFSADGGALLFLQGMIEFGPRVATPETH
jgi:peptidoglycan hydrolase-like protein with peptidoglycan-binding domain